MSNKTLIITVVIILLVAGGVVAAFQTRNSKEQTDSYSDTTSTTSTQKDPIPLNDTAATSQPAAMPSAQPSPTTTMTNDQTCKRDFNASTLSTAKVAIANRQVEMDVKDFGKIRFELYDKDAPKAVENFLRLTNSGYYNCLTFHRIAKNFVIQAGDPNGNGTGGQSAFGASFADELDPNTSSGKAGYVKGVLAMANSGPNTNGSQFFIMLGDVQLSYNYTIFGKVIAGQDIVDKIGKVDIIPQMGPTDGSPVTAVVMQSVKIVK